MSRWNVIHGPKPESAAENTFVREVRNDGSMTRKMNGMGYRHWPDQLVLKKRVKRPLWLEFKREGEDATPAQKFIHAELRAVGQTVHVVHTFEEAWTIYCAHR